MDGMRINELTLIIGRKGTGKTPLIKKNFINNWKEKVLIVDCIDHPAWRFVPIIPANKINKYWKQGTYRVISSDINKEVMPRLAHKDFMNCLIVFEDATRYIKGDVDDDVVRFIIDAKQKNLELLMVFHSFGLVPPDICRNAEKAVILKSAETPECRKKYIANWKQATEAYNKIMASDNPHAETMISLI